MNAIFEDKQGTTTSLSSNITPRNTDVKEIVSEGITVIDPPPQTKELPTVTPLPESQTKELPTVTPLPDIVSPTLPSQLPSPTLRSSKRRHKKNPKYSSNNVTIQTRLHMMTAMAMDDKGGKLRYESAMHSSEGALWEAASNKEFDRLIEDTQTGEWIAYESVPKDRTISYYNPQLTRKRRPVETHPGGFEFRIRGTYGGDRGDYKGPTMAETSDIVTLKILLNSVISDPDPETNWLSTDVVDYYLGTPMARKEYMRVPVKFIPKASMIKYNLHRLVHKGAVIMQLNKGIYGLKQAGRLAQQRMITHLSEHGYERMPNSPCLFVHKTNSVSFTLVVDDFGVKYTGKDDANHLLATLEKLYKIKTNWTGSSYIGFDIKLGLCPHTKVRTATMSMPRFLPSAVKRFNIQPCRAVHNPIDYQPGVRTAIQLPTPEDTSPAASPADTLRIQEIVGVVLYYARALDSTFLVAVNKVSSAQAKPTQAVLMAAENMLLYAATHPAAELVFYASKMDLIVHSDASYLSETRSRSRAAGVFFLGDRLHPEIINAPILCISSILDVTVAAATEAEYGTAFVNTKQTAPLRITLNDLRHPQAPTLMFIDNKAAVGIANETVTQRHSKAMDMRYHFVRDRVRQKQIEVTWGPGRENLADYLSKAHPTKHFVAMRPFFVSTPLSDGQWTTVGRYAPPQALHRRLTLADLPDPRSPTPVKPGTK